MLSRTGEKNEDCHQSARRHGPRNKELHLKRIGWLYPIFRDVYLCHGLLGDGPPYGCTALN